MTGKGADKDRQGASQKNRQWGLGRQARWGGGGLNKKRGVKRQQGRAKNTGMSAKRRQASGCQKCRQVAVKRHEGGIN